MSAFVEVRPIANSPTRLLMKPPPTIIRSASFQFLSFKNRRTTTASSWANDSMALAHGQKGRAASSGGSLKSGMQSPLLRGFAKSLLHVACGLVGSPLRLVKLALGLHFLVAGYLTGSVLDSAFRLVAGAFDVFAVHGTSSVRVSLANQRRLNPCS